MLIKKYARKLIFNLLLIIPLTAVSQANSQTEKVTIKVTLDCFYNYEWRKNAAGIPVRFHYIWEETDPQGFSIFGKIFTDMGTNLSSLETAPTKKNLKGTDIYIIVDPDNIRDNPTPNNIQPVHIEVINDWVSQGGVLVLMANDSTNCDLFYLNNLSENFGITFSNRSRNMVKEDDFQVGSVLFSENEIFKKTKKAYLKEISILELKPPARAEVSMGNDVIMAVSKYGKGTVFAVGDPWLYNEYVDGKKIPAEFENAEAGKELVGWLIKQTAE